jgi:hypothetical protein
VGSQITNGTEIVPEYYEWDTSTSDVYDTDNKHQTSIIISGKTLIIRAAEGYSPTITSANNKPLVILERDASQKSTTYFDKIIVDGEHSL